jgi:hypothetical protein
MVKLIAYIWCDSSEAQGALCLYINWTVRSDQIEASEGVKHPLQSKRYIINYLET